MAIARDKKAGGRVRVAAWNALLDRGIGKPTLSVAFDTTAHIPKPVVLVYGPPDQVPDELPEGWERTNTLPPVAPHGGE